MSSSFKLLQLPDVVLRDIIGYLHDEDLANCVEAFHDAGNLSEFCEMILIEIRSHRTHEKLVKKVPKKIDDAEAIRDLLKPQYVKKMTEDYGITRICCSSDGSTVVTLSDQKKLKTVGKFKLNVKPKDVSKVRNLLFRDVIMISDDELFLLCNKDGYLYKNGQWTLCRLSSNRNLFILGKTGRKIILPYHVLDVDTGNVQDLVYEPPDTSHLFDSEDSMLRNEVLIHLESSFPAEHNPTVAGQYIVSPFSAKISPNGRFMLFQWKWWAGNKKVYFERNETGQYQEVETEDDIVSFLADDYLVIYKREGTTSGLFLAKGYNDVNRTKLEMDTSPEFGVSPDGKWFVASVSRDYEEYFETYRFEQGQFRLVSSFPALEVCRSTLELVWYGVSNNGVWLVLDAQDDTDPMYQEFVGPVLIGHPIRGLKLLSSSEFECNGYSNQFLLSGDGKKVITSVDGEFLKDDDDDDGYGDFDDDDDEGIKEYCVWRA